MKIIDSSVLFARQDSYYKEICADVWDIDRDARNFTGTCPVVAHPPCRAWGRLRGMAKPRPDEKELALFAIGVVRKNGGVLEHPASSSLWPMCGLPRPSEAADEFGGWTLPIVQYWWGHRAMKATWLYIVGVAPSMLPEIPLKLGDSPRVITTSKGMRKGMVGFRSEVTDREREATPPLLAQWLLELAARVKA
jgi:hypothetical protein